MWTQHNPRVLLVSLLWYQKVVFDKSLIFSKILYLGLYFRAIHQQCMLFWIGNGGTLIEFKREIKLVHEIDLVCDHLHHTKGLLITNWEPSELSLYKFKPVWRITFETLWDKLQNLLGMKLTINVILLFLSAVNNNVIIYFFYVRRCRLWK